jgi:hypothetical protein
MKQIFLIILGILYWFRLSAQKTGLPVIDMHLLAQEEIWMNTLYCFPQPCEGPANQVKKPLKLLPRTVEEMNKYNIVLGVLMRIREISFITMLPGS